MYATLLCSLMRKCQHPLYLSSGDLFCDMRKKNIKKVCEKRKAELVVEMVKLLIESTGADKRDV